MYIKQLETDLHNKNTIYSIYFSQTLITQLVRVSNITGNLIKGTMLV